MSPFSQEGRCQLAEQFADIFQMSQDEYRELIAALRDDDIDLDSFSRQAEALLDQMVKLKRIRIQLVQEREELAKGQGSA